MLREGARAYEIVIVEEDFRALPDGTDVLLMVHPPAMDEWQSYVIDQFLLNTGRGADRDRSGVARGARAAGRGAGGVLARAASGRCWA